MANSQPITIASNQSPVSVAGTLNLTGNPSISGTVNIGNAPSVYGNISGSVVAFQGTNPWIVTGSVQASITPAANQSVSGTVGASIIGLTPIRIGDSSNASVITLIQSSVAVNIISGSIAASFTPPANQSVSGTVQTDVRGSVATVIIGGSIAASFVPPANQSVSGTVGASVIGHAPVVIVGGSIAASFTPPANQSVSGTVNIGTGGPISVLGTMSVLGTVPVTQTTNPWIITGSVQGSFSPSGNQSVSGTVGASIIGSVPINGSYAEDTAHTTGNVGLFTLGVRNDTMASVTSADGDYSPNTVGPVGEAVTANAPITKWVSGQGSIFYGVIQPIIPAQGASIFTYITSYQAVNASANNAYLTLYGATDSVVGYTTVPANGGSNVIMPNALKTNANAAFSASVSGVASVFLTAEGFISKV